MIIMDPGDKRTASIVAKRMRQDRLYRLSDFAFLFSGNTLKSSLSGAEASGLEEGDYFLLHSTLTGMTVQLSEQESMQLTDIRKHPIRGCDLDGAGLSCLVTDGFLVERDSDDYEQYESIRFVLRTMSREEKGTKFYAVLPTTACNARCFYCYEQGMTARTMDTKTADQTAAFIERTRWHQPVKITWLGGEPLVAAPSISRICKRLNDKNVPFHSQMITNGTLMSPQLLEEAVKVWHLDTVQVSVDGNREDYEARKSFLDPRHYNYESMLRAAGLFLSAGMEVRIRCNIDEDNVEGLTSFFDDVKEHFGCPDNLLIYLNTLFQNNGKESTKEFLAQMKQMNQYLEQEGFHQKAEEPYRFRINRCMADSGDKNVAIDPEGNLFHCMRISNEMKPFGSIFDENAAVCSDPRADWPVDEQCRHCLFLPGCTPFWKHGCLNWHKNCYHFKMKALEDRMKKRIGL